MNRNFSLLFLSLWLIQSCATVPSIQIPATNIEINTNVAISTRASGRLIANVLPPDHTDGIPSWTSFNPDVLNLRSDGSWDGLLAGNARVMVKIGDLKDSATLTVQGVSYRYIRIVMNGNTETTSGNHLTEVSLMNGTNRVTDIAVDSVVVTTPGVSASGSILFDGEDIMGGFKFYDAGDGSKTINIDLGLLYSFERVGLGVIISGDRVYTDVRVSVSVDNTTFKGPVTQDINGFAVFNFENL